MEFKEALKEFLKEKKRIEYFKNECSSCVDDKLIEALNVVESCLYKYEELIKDNLLLYLIKKEICDTTNAYCGNTKEERQKVNDYIDRLEKIKEWSEEPTSKEKLGRKLKMKNGQKFIYKGIEFIKLDDVDGGALCITSKIWEYLPFDHNWKKAVYNNFKESDIKRTLNTYFLNKLNKDDLVPFEIDLEQYGKDTVLVGLLTKEQYEKYKDLIPNMDWYWWLASPHRSYTYIAYYVNPDGSLNSSCASYSYGAVPACVFKSSILESPSLDGTTKMEDN